MTKTICKERPPMKGRLCLKIIRDGQIIQESQDNLIVAQGRNNLAKLLGGQTGMHVAQVGVGTGSAEALSTDMGLTGTVKVNIAETRVGVGLEAEDGTTFNDSRIVQFHFVLGTSAAIDVPISEYGLFCADDSLFSRIVRPTAFTKTALDRIIGFWQIQF